MATLEEILEEVRASRRETEHLRLLIEARAEGPIASEAEVDGEHGDLTIKFDPKTWRGPSFKGSRMSQASPEFLDHLARAFANIAENEDRDRKEYKGKPASKLTRSNAARARRWALRKRMGWAPPVASEAMGEPPPLLGAGAAPAFGGPSGFDSGPSFGESTGGFGGRDTAPKDDLVDEGEIPF